MSPDLALAHRLLEQHFGFSSFRPGQERLVAAGMSGRDALGVLPTGGGKSLCYQVPALALPGLTLVLSPLISLMEDQTKRAVAARIPAAFLTSGLSSGQRRRVLREAVDGSVKLLFAAPERLETPGFVEALRTTRVSLVAVDEAHCISEWGHDFRPSYRRIGLLRERLRAPFMALTATATPRVREDIIAVLGLVDPVPVVGSFDRPNLAWHMGRAEDHGSKVRVIRRMVREEKGAVLVYAGTRRVVEVIRADLARLGVAATAYHAGLEPRPRSRVQDDFLSGRTRVVVATNAFGMGVDKSDVRPVLHYQLPGTLESYYQEAGRAGRDGAPARCVALHGRHDHRLHEAFIDRSRPPVRVLKRARRALHKAVGAGARGLLDVDLAARDARCTGEEFMGTLEAIERLGSVRIYGGSGPRGSDWPLSGNTDPRPKSERSRECELLDVGVRSSDPDWSGPRRLREAALDGLRAVRAYADAGRCRRAVLLEYFGDGTPACGGCDLCDAQSRRGSRRIFVREKPYA